MRRRRFCADFRLFAVSTRTERGQSGGALDAAAAYAFRLPMGRWLVVNDSGERPYYPPDPGDTTPPALAPSPPLAQNYRPSGRVVRQDHASIQRRFEPLFVHAVTSPKIERCPNLRSPSLRLQKRLRHRRISKS